MRTSGSVDRRARVVVVGAGFAGASFVRHLPQSCRRSGATLLIDRSPTYPFIPLIHEVAVGRIHPGSVQSSIPRLCKNRCGFLQAEVTGGEHRLQNAGDLRGYRRLRVPGLYPRQRRHPTPGSSGRSPGDVLDPRRRPGASRRVSRVLGPVAKGGFRGELRRSRAAYYRHSRRRGNRGGTRGRGRGPFRLPQKTNRPGAVESTGASRGCF